MSVLFTAGTLVVMAPSREGLIVAADSRSLRANGVICDTAYKIVEVNLQNPTVASVTGLGKITGYPAGIDVCTHPGRIALDLEEVTRQHLERHGLPATNDDMVKLATASIAAVQHAQGLDPRIPQLYVPYRGKRVYEIAVGSYDPKKQEATIARVVVRVSVAGGFEIADETYVKRVTQGDESQLTHFGQSDYVNGPLLQVGRHHIARALAFLGAQKPVSATSPAEASEAAANLIEGASRLTATIPAEAPIGGPIDIVLLGSARRPKRLQWK